MPRRGPGGPSWLAAKNQLSGEQRLPAMAALCRSESGGPGWTLRIDPVQHGCRHRGQAPSARAGGFEGWSSVTLDSQLRFLVIDVRWRWPAPRPLSPELPKLGGGGCGK